MNLGKFLLVVVLAGILASFTDWVFMDLLFHDKYMTTPQLWRPAASRNEPSFIVWSQIIGVLSSAAFAYLCVRANALTIPSSLAAAALVWIAGPAVVFAQMVMWTTLNPLVGASQSVGWLVRFIITGLLAVWLL
jgi:hypothetical protein